jgi:hypothetical protein
MSRWHTTDFDLLPEHAFRPMGGGGKFGKNMTLEGGGKNKAPAPDPRMGEAANRQIELNEKMFADFQENERPWMRGIADEAMGISRANAQRSNDLSDYQLDTMKFNDDRYRNVAIPFEDQLLQDVNRFDSQGYKDNMIASSMGDVQSAFSGAAEQQRRGLARMGVNPNSGRMAAMSSQGGFEQAKAMADAANKTRQAAEQVGLSTKMSMYGGMKGLAGLGNANAGLAMNSMGMSNASGAGMTGAAGSYLGANNAALGGFNSGMSSGIQGLGNYSNLGIRAAEVNAQNDPLNVMLGAAAGVGTSWALSDRRLKKNIRKLGEMGDGLGVYQYEYVWGGGDQIGVMADEVLKLRPQAYIQIGAYGAVDYAKL